MKLTGLNIDGFGVWKDLQLDQLSPGVTALHGAKRSG